MHSRREPATRTGRRPSTTRESLAAVGIELFRTRGFDATSVDDIADAAGIARRAFFRSIPSKNARASGAFDGHLDRMRRRLAEVPRGDSLADALTAALLDFNTFPAAETDRHRARMELILRTPALLGYSSVMYQGWRAVIAEFVARRTGAHPDDHIPRTVAYLVLGVAVSSYEQWLTDADSDLHRLLETGMRVLSAGLDSTDREIERG